MSTLFDMISAIVALLMSAALLHFGGSAAPRDESPPAEISRPHSDDNSASPPNQRESMVGGDRHARGSDDRNHSNRL